MEDEPLDEQVDPMPKNGRSKQILMLRDCIADLVAIIKDQEERISTLEDKVRKFERKKP